MSNLNCLSGLKNCRSSRTLFTNDDGSPVSFFADPALLTEYEDLKLIITNGGGFLSETRKDHTINLCGSIQNDLIKEGFLPLSYIKKCVIRSVFINPNSFRNQLVGSQPEALQSPQPQDEFDEEFDLIHTRMIQVPSTTRGRSKYSAFEDFTILDYIIKEKAYKRLKGNALWKDLENLELTCHSSQSMRSRFHKTILPRLDDYDLPPEAKERLRGGKGRKAWEDSASEREEEETEVFFKSSSVDSESVSSCDRISLCGQSPRTLARKTKTPLDFVQSTIPTAKEGFISDYFHPKRKAMGRSKDVNSNQVAKSPLVKGSCAKNNSEDEMLVTVVENYGVEKWKGGNDDRSLGFDMNEDVSESQVSENVLTENDRICKDVGESQGFDLNVEMPEARCAEDESENQRNKRDSDDAEASFELQAQEVKHIETTGQDVLKNLGQNNDMDSESESESISLLTRTKSNAVNDEIDVQSLQADLPESPTDNKSESSYFSIQSIEPLQSLWKRSDEGVKRVTVASGVFNSKKVTLVTNQAKSEWRKTNKSHDKVKGVCIAVADCKKSGLIRRIKDGEVWKMDYDTIGMEGSERSPLLSIEKNRELFEESRTGRFNEHAKPSTSKNTTKVKDSLTKIEVASSTSSKCSTSLYASSEEEENFGCVSKEVTRRRIQAIMDSYNLELSEAIDFMTENQHKFWPISD